MSDDEIKQGLRRMMDSGKLTGMAAREAQNNPIEGEKIVRLDRIEDEVADIKVETNRQSLALFGDLHLNGGINPGMVKNVQELRIIVFRAVWSITGVITFCTFLLTVLGIYLEAKK